MTQHTVEATKQPSQTRTPAGKLIRTDGGFVWHIDDEDTASKKALADAENLATRRSSFRPVRRSGDLLGQPPKPKENDGNERTAGYQRPEEGFQRYNDSQQGMAVEHTERSNVRFHVVSPRPLRRVRNRPQSSAFKSPMSVWTMLLDRLGKTAKRFEAAPATWADHFRRGALAGLVLGCLSLILFHQVALPAASAPLPGQTANPSNVQPALATNSSYQLTLPSAKVYMMQFGPFQTTSEADAIQKQLGQAGVTGQVVQEKSGFFVWVNTALARQDVMNGTGKLHSASSQAKASVKLVSWAAESLPTTVVDSSAGEEAANRWFAAIVTALRVETGAAAGETATRDVRQAVQNASSEKPSDSIWSTGSEPASLKSLYNDIVMASTLLAKNQAQQAEGEILSAWAELYASRQQALSNN